MENYEVLNQRIVSMAYEICRLSKEVTTIMNVFHVSPSEMDNTKNTITNMRIYRSGKDADGKNDTHTIPRE